MTTCIRVSKRSERPREKAKSWSQTLEMQHRPRTHHWVLPATIHRLNNVIELTGLLLMREWNIRVQVSWKIKVPIKDDRQHSNDFLRFPSRGWATACDSKKDLKPFTSDLASRASACRMVIVSTGACFKMRTNFSSLSLRNNLYDVFLRTSVKRSRTGRSFEKVSAASNDAELSLTLGAIAHSTLDRIRNQRSKPLESTWGLLATSRCAI